MQVVGVIQARMGSTRLPGKTLEPIAGRALVLWTISALESVPGLDRLVVATTDQPQDDRLAAFLDGRVDVHRGSVHDVLSRLWEAVAGDRPDYVVRETADNPFVDPDVVRRQVARCIEGGFDYVGTAGWPLGIAAEVARGEALAAAYRESVDPAEREHVMPFLYARPGRFRIGTLPADESLPAGRFTVDTSEDLAFARAVADRLGQVPHATLDGLRRVVDAEPELVKMNAAVRQRPWQEVGR